MYQQVLQNLGWSPDEVSTYATLLQLGTQPASVLARHLDKKRTTVRVYLERLAHHGYVRLHWKGRTQYFTAKNPNEALEALKRTKIKTLERCDQNIRAFSAILPELTSIVHEDIHLPKVVFYEGADELKRMYADSLTSQTEVLCLSSIEDLLELFGKQYDHWYVTKRVKKGIQVRYIAKGSPLERTEAKKDKRYLRQSRHLPEKLFPISNEINIYDDKVSIITLKNEKIGLLIQSQEIYRSMKVIFELLWRMAK